MLKTIEGAFRLPCLNHACDAQTKTITTLFQADDGDNDADER